MRILHRFRDPHFGVFWGLWLLLGYLASYVQNLMTYCCSATPISYKCDEISRLSRLVIEIPIMGYLGVFRFWGYLATSDANSCVIFLLSDPDFL